jgi:hypothetical protein
VDHWLAEIDCFRLIEKRTVQCSGAGYSAARRKKLRTRFQTWLGARAGWSHYAVSRIGPAGEFLLLFFQCGLPGEPGAEAFQMCAPARTIALFAFR